MDGAEPLAVARQLTGRTPARTSSPGGPLRARKIARMRLIRAQAIVDDVVANASGPVSVFVADAHGELVAAATMNGAAPDTRLNAQRKAYTAARSDATSTRELAEKARADPVERASFDPFFTFFLGGIAVFEDGRRVDAVGRERPARRRRRAARTRGNRAHDGRYLARLAPGNSAAAGSAASADRRKQHSPQAASRLPLLVHTGRLRRRDSRSRSRQEQQSRPAPLLVIGGESVPDVV